MTSTALPASSSARRVLLAALVAAGLAGAVNGAIAVGAVAAGVPGTLQLTPSIDVAFSIVAGVVGAAGWETVRRRAADPRRLLVRLVPAVLLLSFVPDVLLGVATAAETGLSPVLTLALMHVTTITLAVATYARLLPVGRASRT